MRTLLIDNYDSYTFNLFALLAAVNGEEPVVVRNDERPWPALAAEGFDAIVLSPGPGHPARPRDFGVCADALAHATVPVLGVCLGHQGLAVAAGGVVDEADEPMHGRLSAVRHDGTGLFRGLPQGFQAVRYHSLAVRRVPDALRLTAWTDSGVVMGLADPRRPRFGVQFHPESIATEHGAALLRNFRDIALSQPPGPSPQSRTRPGGQSPQSQTRLRGRTFPETVVEVAVRRVGRGPDPEDVFVALLAQEPYAFWLDTAAGGPGARWSFMGACDAPPALGAGGALERIAEELARRRAALPAGCPVPFAGGLVGYLGYELKAECGGARAHQSALPDAALLAAERVLAHDGATGEWHLVAPGGEPAAREWLDRTQRALEAVAPAPPPAPAPTAGTAAFTAREDAGAYAAAVRACQAAIRAGETYEACLTTELRSPARVDALALHRRLRRTNPAPYAAYLRLGDTAIVSSSPERFLRVSATGIAESRPIKGTAARAADPQQDAARAAALAASEKDRAENLMIVDLVRNDLTRVCEPASVEAPGLMEVETHATVHHLVSTVRGRLRPGATAIDAIRACFPPGSMTGAPKLRTMEILDALEGRARGPYSGALGYLGVDGAADLSVVIRAAVVTPDGVAIGSGGAVVAQSDPEAEHAEMLLKAAPVIAAVFDGAAPR